jgi:acyl-CoA reductase-like NAD-dependent aldehyde dehydrogenase
VTVFVVCQSIDDMTETLKALEGNLTATIHAEESRQDQASKLYGLLREKAGRLIWNGFPTGVAVVPSMVHGGPMP